MFYIISEDLLPTHTHPIVFANFCSANFRVEFLQDEVQAVRSFLKHKLLKLIQYMAKTGDITWGNSLSELTEIR